MLAFQGNPFFQGILTRHNFVPGTQVTETLPHNGSKALNMCPFIGAYWHRALGKSRGMVEASGVEPNLSGLRPDT